MWAAEQGHVAVVELLVRRGADAARSVRGLDDRSKARAGICSGEQTRAVRTLPSKAA